mmetsp:Transcript_23177/g.23073  ORF Transcript_23177/g.23073 Transcript_23177/m.23073 type:complete len:85 (-) Transcript_23177:3563-3817(-)
MNQCRKIPSNYKVTSWVNGGNKIRGAINIEKCGINEYTDGMHETCTKCDDAHQCHTSQIVTPCPHGHAKFGGVPYCTPCPPGKV